MGIECSVLLYFWTASSSGVAQRLSEGTWFIKKTVACEAYGYGLHFERLSSMIRGNNFPADLKMQLESTCFACHSAAKLNIHQDPPVPAHIGTRIETHIYNI
jgi:hypothetical protein